MTHDSLVLFFCGGGGWAPDLLVVGLLSNNFIFNSCVYIGLLSTGVIHKPSLEICLLMVPFYSAIKNMYVLIRVNNKAHCI